MHPTQHDVIMDFCKKGYSDVGFLAGRLSFVLQIVLGEVIYELFDDCAFIELS